MMWSSAGRSGRTLSRGGVALACVWVVLSGSAAPGRESERLSFVAHTIATGLTGGYQTVVSDLNRDGRPDIIALATRLPDLVWYENPGWERHVITTNLNRPINLAAHDVDNDGVPELALAHGFATSHDESAGIVLLLTHEDDPRQPWTVREVDRLPTTHRLRWADIDGSGSKVLINAPLVGKRSTRPEYRDTLSLVWYRPEDWRRQEMTDAEQGVVHGLGVAPWGDSARDAVLSASFLGVHVHEFIEGRWRRSRVTPGDPAPWPESGASEAQVGHLSDDRFVATIEPWHGHQVVVYRPSAGGEWTRHPIDTTIEDGHTLVVADLDDDGRDEIIAGERKGRQSVYVYDNDPGTGRWSRQILDDGDMAAAGCDVADVNADGRADIVCIGTGTANLKWYENVSR